MSYRMFLDDERDPPGQSADWIVVRCVKDAQNCVETRGFPAFISFDHDLGPDETAMDFVHWLGELILDRGQSGLGFEFTVHSQNPVGARNIEAYLTRLASFLGR